MKRFIKESPAVFGLLAANILLYGIKWLLAPDNGPNLPYIENPVDKLFNLHFPGNPDMHLWQFLSHMFMHGSEFHLLANMFGVFSFGSLLERVWGTRRFIVFYLVAGLGAGLIYTGVNVYEFGTYIDFLTENRVSAQAIQTYLNTGFPISDIARLLNAAEMNAFRSLYLGQMLGASGALYGILVAFAILVPNAKVVLIFLPVPIAAKYFVPAIIGFDLISQTTGFSLFGGGIAHTAHIGGAIIGFCLMMYWRKTLPKVHFQ